MFDRDFNTLNNLYLKQIIKENVGLGPKADQDSSSGLSPVKQALSDAGVPQKDCNCGCNATDEDCEECGGTCGGTRPEGGENADMARRSLYRLVKMSAMLHDLVQNDSHIEPWILTKIADAQQNIESVYSYQDYEKFKHTVDHDIENLEEETEHDLYKTINNGGSTILSQLKKLLATESKDVLESILLETISALEVKRR